MEEKEDKKGEEKEETEKRNEEQEEKRKVGQWGTERRRVVGGRGRKQGGNKKEEKDEVEGEGGDGDLYHFKIKWKHGKLLPLDLYKYHQHHQYNCWWSRQTT